MCQLTFIARRPFRQVLECLSLPEGGVDQGHPMTDRPDSYVLSVLGVGGMDGRLEWDVVEGRGD
jgi:hypothetical protein